MTEIMHRRFVDRAFSATADHLTKPFIVAAGVEISVVTSDLDSGLAIVRLTTPRQSGFLMADRAALIRSTRR